MLVGRGSHDAGRGLSRRHQARLEASTLLLVIVPAATSSRLEASSALSSAPSAAVGAAFVFGDDDVAPARLADDSDSSDEEAAAGKKVGKKPAKKVVKKAGILLEVSKSRGAQLPLADPLVSAVLLDDDGMLFKYCQPSTPSHDPRTHKLKWKGDATSHVWTVRTSDEKERLQLTSRVHSILERRLAVALNDD